MWISTILIVSGDMGITSLFDFNHEEKYSGMYSTNHHNDSGHHGMMNETYDDGDYCQYHESSNNEEIDDCDYHGLQDNEDYYCASYHQDDYCNQTSTSSGC